MPKKCDSCQQDFRGFGPTFPDCRKSAGRRSFGGSPGGLNPAGDGTPSSKRDPGSNRCVKCEKVAYAMERISVEGEVFHPTCFRCTRCECKLNPSDFSKSDGKYYCKPHFAELFMVKGRYEFGNA